MEKTQKLTLVNLDTSTDWYFELHKSGCRDLSKNKGTQILVSSIQDAKDYIEADDIGWSLNDHCKVFGCVNDEIRG
jgi:hypothetical protein